MQKQEKIPALTTAKTAANLKEEIRLLEAALARKEIEILVMEAELAKQAKKAMHAKKK